MRPLALTLGEPGGIGADITLAAWHQRHQDALEPFVVYGCPHQLRHRGDIIGTPVPLAEIDDPADAADLFNDYLPIIPITSPDIAIPGQANPAHAIAVIAALEAATEATLNGRCRALVTNPIHKLSLIRSGFAYPGHTDYLAARCRASNPQSVENGVAMMLQGPHLRVVLATVHIPLRDVAASLDCQLITRIGRLADTALRHDFGLSAPRLVVAALNPHGGEGGAFGDEEITLIAPAIRILAEAGINIEGPLPADTLFHTAARQRYDAVLCLYHDQALIPLKTLDFDCGVNITLGLPIVRTSPDHGTAFDLAGSGNASPRSLIAALKTATTLIQRRCQNAHQRASL